jgi:DNA-binding response OmpR family regulator
MKITLLGDFTGHPVAEWLHAAGQDVAGPVTEVDVASALGERKPDLLLLNLKPSPILFVTLSRLRRQFGPSLPIVTILPDDREEHVVAGLRNGADDCIAAPLRRDEFLARVTLPNRWRSGPIQSARMEIGCFSVDLAGRKLWHHGLSVALTEKDFDLAVMLLSNVGRMLSRGYIASAVWGGRTVPSSRTIDTHISRVRNKLRLREGEGWRLEAIYGKGYRLLRIDDHAQNASARSPLTNRPSGGWVTPSGQGQAA